MLSFSLASGYGAHAATRVHRKPPPEADASSVFNRCKLKKNVLAFELKAKLFLVMDGPLQGAMESR